MHAKPLQSCLPLCDLMDCSPPDSSVHGILQARILKCVAMPSSRGSSQPRDGTRISSDFSIAGMYSLVLSHQGSPNNTFYVKQNNFSTETMVLNRDIP